MTMTKHDHPSVLIYSLECSSKDVLVITEGAWGATMYLYALHPFGGDHKSERLDWTPELIEAFAKELPKGRRQAHQINVDATHTAAWHYGADHSASPGRLAALLAKRSPLSLEQIKDYEGIVTMIKGR